MRFAKFHHPVWRSWLAYWEIPLIALVAAFLRFFAFQNTYFNNDQAALFQMARYAITHGLIPATANRSSLSGFSHGPATVDLLMLPAALSNNPLWAAWWTALLATVAVVLTYILVRRYYGRMAATIAALLYATLFRAVFFARFIWNPNLLPPFVVLLLMVLLQGVVARRPGWLAWALLWFGIAVQLHESAGMLIFPLLLAFLLAPRTIRWRDLVLGLLALLLVNLPYLLWERSTHFQGLSTIIQSFLHPQSPAVFDGSAWAFYQNLLSPYHFVSPGNSSSDLLWQFASSLAWTGTLLVLLVLLSMGILLVWALRTPHGQEAGEASGWQRLRRSWSHLRDEPERCGLLILLAWQITPLLVMWHHALKLQLHYFIFLLPGPCILLGVFLGKLLAWLDHGALPTRVLAILQRKSPSWVEAAHSRLLGKILSFMPYALAGLLIVCQLIGSVASILGSDRSDLSNAYGARAASYLINDLASVRNAIAEADQLAHQYQASRVSITASLDDKVQHAKPTPKTQYTKGSINVLSDEMHMAVTVFNPPCIVLPNPRQGPAVMLVGPDDEATMALLSQVAKVQLLGLSQRLTGAPFRLYLVSSYPEQPMPQAILGQDQAGPDLQLVAAPQRRGARLITRWTLLRNAPPAYRQTYTYTLKLTQASHSATSQCTFTALRAGDQIIAPFKGGTRFTSDQAIKVQGQFSETSPRFLKYGPFTLLTLDKTTRVTKLRTPEHEGYLLSQIRI